MPQRTKAGEHDDTIAFGHWGSPFNTGGKPWVATLIARLARRRRGSLFGSLSLSRFEAVFKTAALRAGVASLRLTPHCARHGAASTAYATGRLSLKDIQKRGRWRSHQSVRVYEKSARFTRQLCKMTIDQRNRANLLAAALPGLLSQGL